MQNSLGGRVGPEDLEELAAFLDLGQHVPDVFGVAVPLEVDEVHVLPGAPLGRSRLDLGQVEPPRRERAAGCCTARPARSSSRRGSRSCRGPVGAPRAARSPGSAWSWTGCPRCARAGSAHRRAARPSRRRWRPPSGRPCARSADAVVDGISSMRDVRQVRCEPLAALGERLRVRAHDLDLGELRRPREEVLGDVERHLAGDQRRRCR